MTDKMQYGIKCGTSNTAALFCVSFHFNDLP